MIEKAIMVFKGQVDNGTLNSVQAASLSKESIALSANMDAGKISDNELNHVKYHVGLYAQHQEAVKQAQTVLDMLAGTYPKATARLLAAGKIMVCLDGEKPLEPDDTGIVTRATEAGKL